MSRRLGGRGAAAGSSPACGWVGSLSLAAGVARLVRPSVYPSVRLFVCVCLSVCLPRSGPPRQDSHALEGAGRAPLALPPARVPVLGLLRPRVVLATAHMQRRCSCILGSSGIAQRLRDQACSPSGSGGDLLARRRRWEAEREGRGGRAPGCRPAFTDGRRHGTCQQPPVLPPLGEPAPRRAGPRGRRGSQEFVPKFSQVARPHER